MILQDFDRAPVTEWAQAFVGDLITLGGQTSRIQGEVDRRAEAVTGFWVTQSAPTTQYLSSAPGTITGEIAGYHPFPAPVNTILYAPPYPYDFQPEKQGYAGFSEGSELPSGSWEVTEDLTLDLTYTDTSTAFIGDYRPVVILFHRRRCVESDLQTSKGLRQLPFQLTYTAGLGKEYVAQKLILPNTAKRLRRIEYVVTATGFPFAFPIFFGLLSIVSTEKTDGYYPILMSRGNNPFPPFGGQPNTNLLPIDNPVIHLSRPVTRGRTFYLTYRRLIDASVSHTIEGVLYYEV